MRKILLGFAVLVVLMSAGSAWATSIKIDSTNFPDEVFRNYVSAEFDKDSNESLDDNEIQEAKKIEVVYKAITSLKGIEHFKALSVLNCYSSDLKELDLSQNTELTELGCGHNRLNKLDLSRNTKLAKLYCTVNNLAMIDLSNNHELTTTDISNQTITLAGVSYDNTKKEDYPYYINLNYYKDRITSGDVSDFMKNSKISTTEIKDIDGAIITDYLSDDVEGILYLSAKPGTLKYVYTVNYTANDDTAKTASMTVTVNFTDKSRGVGDVDISSTFPDVNFRSFVETRDSNKDGILSEQEIRNTKTIDVHTKSISSLAGISYFRYVTDLNCYINSLKELDLSSNTKLTKLNCAQNSITTLNLSKNTALTELTCSNNPLNGLDVSKNTALTTLNCASNGLTTLDVSKNTALTEIHCRNNKLTTIDVSKNTNLETLDCYDNSLIAIDLGTKNPASLDLDLTNQSASLTGEHITGTTVYSINFRKYYSTIDMSKISNLSSGNAQLTANNYTINNALGTISFYSAYNTIRYLYNNIMDVTATITYDEIQPDNPNNPTDDPAGNNTTGLPAALISRIASRFGIDPSLVHSLADNEKTYDANEWTLDISDQAALSNSGEVIMHSLPVFRAGSSGVYVIECDLGAQNAGKQINFRGITSGWQVGSSAFGNNDYMLFDASTYEQVTDAPSDGKIFVAVSVSAGETLGGIITSIEEKSTIEPVPVTSRDVIRKNIAEALGIDPDKIVFLEEKNIRPAYNMAGQTRPAAVVSSAESDDKAHYEIISGLGTIHDFVYSDDNRYVMTVKLHGDVPPEVNAKSLSDDLSNDIRIHVEEYDAAASLKASFVGFGVINTLEILTLEGKKLEPQDFGIREFLMVALLQSSMPFTIFLAKLIPGLGSVISAIMGGGCNSIGGGIILAVFFLYRRKR